LPATAIFGSSLIFFFILSALIFLIPISLIAAEFASRHSEKGGVFHWVKSAFGEKAAVLAIWLQWINTMVWYPTILSFIAGTAAYLFDPTLAQNAKFLVSIILITFWSLTLLNLRGIHVSARINTLFGVIGLLIPMALLLSLGLIWIFSGKPVQIAFNAASIFPSLSHTENWVSLIAIMASFLGMELAGVHVDAITEPQKNFPKALAWSVLILIITMLFGSLSIAVVIPPGEIRLVDGIMQTFSQFFNAFHMPWFIPVLTVLIIIGSVGNMINWLISPAKGLLQAAEHKFLPPFFSKTNVHGVPVNLLLIQAVLVTLFCLAFILMPSINAFYWFLTALSTELYMIMYVLLFSAALKLGRPKDVLSYRIPFGFRRLMCIFGLFACLITIIIGYFPPSDIQAGSTLRYAILILSGNILLISPVLLLYRYKRRF
jgi:amino acid transporter